MIGKKVLWKFKPDLNPGTAEIEGIGMIVDKVRMSETITEEGRAVAASQNDIYVVMADDGKIDTIHPIYIVKVFQD